MPGCAGARSVDHAWDVHTDEQSDHCARSRAVTHRQPLLSHRDATVSAIRSRATCETRGFATGRPEVCPTTERLDLAIVSFDPDGVQAPGAPSKSDVREEAKSGLRHVTIFFSDI